MKGTETDIIFLEISLIISIKRKISVNFDSATILKIYPTYVLATEGRDIYIERLLSVCIYYMLIPFMYICILPAYVYIFYSTDFYSKKETHQLNVHQ